MSKRAALKPPATARSRRWDRRRVLLTLFAILIVVTMLTSSFIVLFAGQ